MSRLQFRHHARSFVLFRALGIEATLNTLVLCSLLCHLTFSHIPHPPRLVVFTYPSSFLTLSTSVVHAMAPWIYVVVFWFLSASLCRDVTLYLQPGYRFWVLSNSAVMSCFPCDSHSAALGRCTGLLASSIALLATTPVFCLTSFLGQLLHPHPTHAMYVDLSCSLRDRRLPHSSSMPSRIVIAQLFPLPEAALKDPSQASMVSRTCQHPKGCHRFQHGLPRAISQFTLANTGNRLLE